MKMAKRNIRAKAKSAVGAAKQKTQEVQAQLKRAERGEQLLHKTLTPKQSLTKKEKSAQKHKQLIKRFAEKRKQAKEERARKQRENTQVTGDLNPLRDALPPLDDLYKLAKSRSTEQAEQSSEAAVPERMSKNKKMRMKRLAYIEKLRSLQNLITSKKFLRDPKEYIRNHMRIKYNLVEPEAAK
ncbi:hypothetical protein KR222_002964, partial [Zaprionus bogoriensis]